MTDQVNMGVTIQELMQYGEDRWVEVVNGEIREVEMTAGYTRITIIEFFYDTLKPYVKANRLGEIHADGLNYLLSVVANTVRDSRIPDVSFIRKANIPKDFDRDGYFPGAPDLAVEVISPTEDEAILDGKVADYFAAGTEQVWAVFPRPQQVHVFLRDENLSPSERRYHVYKMGDTLEAPTLFPGLKIAIADIFHIDALE